MQFQKQIVYLKKNGYAITRCSEYFSPHQTISMPPAVLFTFDDAFSCFYDQALPVLLTNGMTATVFVITKYIGKVSRWDYYRSSKSCHQLSWSQLRELAVNGCEIGSHSHSHIDLKSAGPLQLKKEMEYSKSLLEDKLGIQVRFFSYPFGRFNQATMQACREAGYQAAFTMNPTAQIYQSFALPRQAVYLFDSLPQFKLKLKTNPPSRFECAKLTVINFCSLGTIIVKKFSSG